MVTDVKLTRTEAEFIIELLDKCFIETHAGMALMLSEEIKERFGIKIEQSNNLNQTIDIHTKQA